jgi:hypothetical protein
MKRTRLMGPGRQLSERVGSGMGRRGIGVRASIATASSAIIFGSKIGRLMTIDGQMALDASPGLSSEDLREGRST